jgi:hypothetical protein
MVGKAKKFHGERSELNSEFGLEKVIRTSAILSRSWPCGLRTFPTMKRELRGKKFRSDQRSAARF